MKLFKALFLALILVLFILVPVFADSARIAEIRSAIFESYSQASRLVTLARDAYLDAADAREAATNYSIRAVNALDGGRFADAVDYAILADEAELLAEHLETEGWALLLLAEDEQRKIVELANEFSEINSVMATENRSVARDLGYVLESLGLPEEVVTHEEAIEEAPEAPTEPVAVLESETWLVGSLIIIEGDAVLDLRDYLAMYPFYIEVFEEEVVISQTELGVRVDGTYIGPDEDGWIGFIPMTFVGIPDDYVYEFFYLVEEFNVELPEVYWFKGAVEGNLATLEARGTIDGSDFHILISFLEQ